MLKVINELKPTKGLVRHIAGFAEQTRQVNPDPFERVGQYYFLGTMCKTGS